MRVLFTTQPADGHLNPMLGLSAALRAAGHEVLFASSASFVPRIEARDERAVAAGLDWLESDGPVEPPDEDADPTGRDTTFPRLFLREVARAMADDLLRIVDRWQPDVIVRESVEFAGAAVAERCGVPFATFDFAFAIDLELLVTTGDIPDAGELEALRRHVGLPGVDDPDWFLGDLQISTLPDGYRRHGRLRERSVVIRPNAVGLVDDAPVPDWVTELEDAVYVSLGTVFTRHYPQVLSAAAAGAAATGRSTVVTYGPSVSASDVALPKAPHVRVERYVPQGPVLERSAAAVTHGGTGTTLGALARGVPLVVVPLGADQFGHARSVETLGAGVVLDAATADADAVRDALETVTSDAAYTEAARAIADSIAAMPGPERAVEALEELVRSHR